MDWIPRTKLRPPEPGPDLLDRSVLLTQLRTEVAARRLTLISAHAGAGKTTLAAALVRRHPELRPAWLSLDERDNQPEAFMTLLLAALGQLLPECPFNSAALLTGKPELASDAIRLMGVLINDILDCEPESLVLVLDDLHVIDDPTCLGALDYLLANLPSGMHLVATARRDPALALSRLRARGQLAEIGIDRLRFSADETSVWLNSALDLELTEQEIAVVDRLTQGWVAAIRLLALSLDQRDALERDELIRALERGTELVVDYLVDEVVNRLPEETRQFLRETSVLDTMTPALCESVTGRGDAHRLLEAIWRQNLFISRNDATGEGDGAAAPVYSYHALLRRALLEDLRRREPDRLSLLHRRAAAAIGPSPDAVRHYIAAGAWEEAAGTLAGLIREQVELALMPATLVDLVDHIPEGVTANRAWLLAARGIHLLQRGHREAGRPLLERAIRLLAEEGDELSQAYLLFNLSSVTLGPEMAVYLDRIGAIFAARGNQVPPRWYVAYHQALVWKHLHAHDWSAVEEHLEAAVEITLRSGDAGAYYTLATNNFTHLMFSRRAAAAILRLRDALLAHLAPDDVLARFGVINIEMCDQWLRGDVSRAEELARTARWMSERYGVFSWADANSMLVSLSVLWIRDRLDEMVRSLTDILDFIARTVAWNVARNDILCWRALIEWRAGRGVDAPGFLPEMERYTLFERQHGNNLLVRALGAAARGELVAADRLMREVIAREEQTGFVVTVPARLLLAVFYWQAGDREAALDELDRGLAEWEGRELPGVVLQCGRTLIPLLEAAVARSTRHAFARRCLDAFEREGQPRPVYVSATGETLTPRESEVLALIVRGRTNPQIADSLTISESTVKTHVSRILAKLAVSRRTEAALLGRRLGLG